MSKEVTNRYGKLLICVLAGIVLWFGLEQLDIGIPLIGGHVFAVFFAVILGFILKPFPMGVIVVLGLVTLSVSGAVTMKESLHGYGDSTVWLVVSAFLIADGVINTGVGRRVALTLIKWFGGTVLGLAYAICGAELILGPVIPSNTARGGGVLAPIVNSVSHALNSFPNEQPNRLGRYLSLVGAHANLITAAMFLTGMAANPLVSKAVFEITGVSFGWGKWALGGLVPGLIGLALLPLYIFKLAKPEIEETKMAQNEARTELKEMGLQLKKEEWVMIGVLVMLVALWSTKAWHGMGTSLVAWIGVCIMLLTRVQSWKQMISNERAWDALMWLGGLLTMANMLKTYGFIDWFVSNVSDQTSGVTGIYIVIVLGIIYFFSMYFFSMLTAHISAMGAAFLAVVFAVTGQPLLGAAIIAYFSCLSGCLTNYSTGPVIIYFGLGYVSTGKWYSTGFFMGLFHITIWFGLGLIWWKLLGWW